MDIRRVKRGDSPVHNNSNADRKSGSKLCPELSSDWGRKSLILTLLAAFLGLSLLFPLFLTFTSVIYQHLDIFTGNPPLQDVILGSGSAAHDLTLGGLLEPPARFGDNHAQQCISRSQEHTLRRQPSKYKPSPYLVSKLREYEQRHRRCAHLAKHFSPGAELNISRSRPSESTTTSLEDNCQFVVWIANSGLGNRIVTLVSSFVYALLTDRILLVEHGTNIDKLFCEPFPETSWGLPDEIPSEWVQSLDQNSTRRFGHLIANSTSDNDGAKSAPPKHGDYALLYLMHDYNDNDRRFFCARSQTYLREFPLLFVLSDQYFVPALHFLPAFSAELDRLFPERVTVFHHMSRYLLRPSNPVWGLIRRFYKTYLAGAQHQVGLQVRILDSNVSVPVVSDQVMSCVLKAKLLPNVTSEDESFSNPGKESSVAVVVASLQQAYYERVKGFYLNGPTQNGAYISVHTPSHEGQQKESFDHDKKAWADIYLLSLSDTLVTSSWSTFGYIAQGLSGVTPWILTKTKSSTTAEETIRVKGPCRQGASLEPCFHAPPLVDCNAKHWGQDPGKVLPFVKHCEDVTWGVKIIDDSSV